MGWQLFDNTKLVESQHLLGSTDLACLYQEQELQLARLNKSCDELRQAAERENRVQFQHSLEEWAFPEMGDPQNRWFIVENHPKMDDLGVPPFQETTIWWDARSHHVKYCQDCLVSRVSDPDDFKKEGRIKPIITHYIYICNNRFWLHTSIYGGITIRDPAILGCRFFFPWDFFNRRHRAAGPAGGDATDRERLPSGGEQEPGGGYPPWSLRGGFHTIFWFSCFGKWSTIEEPHF